jgi:hypothetical protein
VAINAAVQLGATVVVIATDARGLVGALTSDGTGTWTSAATTAIRGDTLYRVESIGRELVAFGGNPAMALMWASRDGTSWRSVDLPSELTRPGAAVSGAAIRGGRAILVGSDPTGGSAIGAIWQGPADILAP